jgi:hypothetical protein
MQLHQRTELALFWLFQTLPEQLIHDASVLLKVGYNISEVLGGWLGCSENAAALEAAFQVATSGAEACIRPL